MGVSKGIEKKCSITRENKVERRIEAREANDGTTWYFEIPSRFQLKDEIEME